MSLSDSKNEAMHVVTATLCIFMSRRHIYIYTIDKGEGILSMVYTTKEFMGRSESNVFLAER